MNTLRAWFFLNQHQFNSSCSASGINVETESLLTLKSTAESGRVRLLQMIKTTERMNETSWEEGAAMLTALGHEKAMGQPMLIDMQD